MDRIVRPDAVAKSRIRFANPSKTRNWKSRKKTHQPTNQRLCMERDRGRLTLNKKDKSSGNSAASPATSDHKQCTRENQVKLATAHVSQGDAKQRNFGAFAGGTDLANTAMTEVNCHQAETGIWVGNHTHNTAVNGSGPGMNNTQLASKCLSS